MDYKISPMDCGGAYLTDDCQTLLDKMERLVASLLQRRREMEPFSQTGQPWQSYVGHAIQMFQQNIMLQNCQILYIFHEPPCSDDGYPDCDPFPLPPWKPEPYPQPCPVPVLHPMIMPDVNVPELATVAATGLALAGAAYILQQHASGGTGSGGCGYMSTCFDYNYQN